MHLSSSHDNQTERTASVRDTSSSQDRLHQTLEQTLFGLTSALEAMHTLAGTPCNPATAWEDAGAGKDTRNNGTITHHQRTGSSAEQLTANASLLFQRKKNDAPTPDDDDCSSVYGGRNDTGVLRDKLSLEDSLVVPTTTPSTTTGR
jgi:hypothetical protein